MIALCFSCTTAMSAETSDGLKLITTRSCFFADEKAVFQLAAEGEGQRGLAWRLVAAGRTVRRGTADAIVQRQNQAMLLEVSVPLPPLEPGIVQQLSLDLTYTHQGRERVLSHPVYAFSRDPFAGQSAWLQNARIKLFDPEGSTAELLDNLSIPYSRLLDLAAVDLVKEGILLAGEGLSLSEHRVLPDALWQAARRGVAVVCLAPSEGDFPLELNNSTDNALPSQLMLGREDFLHHFDKRFDPISGLTQLSLVPVRDRVMLRVEMNQGEWTWLGIEYPQASSAALPGHLVVCTWGIVSQWEETPVHRYLLARILRDLSPNPSHEEDSVNVTRQN